MIERLRELRQLLGLTQGAFAEKIGIKQGSLSDIERGKVGLSNANILLICKTFNVSENWLRTGIGEPFNNKYATRTDLSDLEKDILKKFNLLEDKDRKSIQNIIDSLYQKNLEE